MRFALLFILLLTGCFSRKPENPFEEFRNAVKAGDDARVKEIIESGWLDPRFRDTGDTPIFLYVIGMSDQRKALGLVKVFLSHADLAGVSMGSIKSSALMKAAIAGHIDVYKFLKENGATVDPSIAKKAGGDPVAEMKAYVRACTTLTGSSCAPANGYRNLAGEVVSQP